MEQEAHPGSQGTPIIQEALRDRERVLIMYPLQANVTLKEDTDYSKRRTRRMMTAAWGV